jgi:hypothetical protein
MWVVEKVLQDLEGLTLPEAVALSILNYTADNVKVLALQLAANDPSDFERRMKKSLVQELKWAKKLLESEAQHAINTLDEK